MSQPKACPAHVPKFERRPFSPTRRLERRAARRYPRPGVPYRWEHAGPRRVRR